MTRFRIGGRPSTGQRANSDGRANGIVPANAGIASIAQDRIDLLTSAASRRAKEAISGIDATRLYIFQPLKHGVACNCGTQPQFDVDVEEPSNPYTLGVIEDKPNNPEDMEQILQVRTRDVTAYDIHKMNTSASEPDHNFQEEDIFEDAPIPPKTTTSGTTDPYAPNRSSTGPYEGPMHGDSSIMLHEGEYDHEQPDDLTDEFGEELISDYENDGWNPDSILMDSAYVLGSMTVTCPVCYGSGILGGYSLWGATRLVLSSANATGGENVGTENGTAPPSYTLAPGDTVEWEITNCPNYFTLGWAVARKLRQKADPNLTIAFSITNGQMWLPISSLPNYANQNLSNLIIMATNSREDDQDITFTHLEVTLFHSPVLGQVTNFNQQAGVSAAIKGDGLTITLPPDVGLVSRNSLIADDKYKLMWRVTTVTSVMTAKRQVINCEVNAELMEPTLVETLLYPEYSVDGGAQQVYAGVEPNQGRR